MEGGDTDTNASVTGALVGCYVGFKQLYQECEDWIDGLAYKQQLEQRTIKFIDIALKDIP